MKVTSPASMRAPIQPPGQATAAEVPTHRTAAASAKVPRTWRSTNRAKAVCGERSAAPSAAAKRESARVGNRATHRFIGLPNTPGLVSPWPSISDPTQRQPRASMTSE